MLHCKVTSSESQCFSLHEIWLDKHTLMLTRKPGLRRHFTLRNSSRRNRILSPIRGRTLTLRFLFVLSFQTNRIWVRAEGNFSAKTNNAWENIFLIFFCCCCGHFPKGIISWIFPAKLAMAQEVRPHPPISPPHSLESAQSLYPLKLNLQKGWHLISQVWLTETIRNA